MLDLIRKNKIKFLIIVLIVLVIISIFIMTQIKKDHNDDNWKKLGYEDTNNQVHDLKVFQFGMEDCEPCIQMEPVYNQIVEKYKQELDFEYIDVNLKPNLTDKYKINVLPAYIIVNKNGEVINRKTGKFTFEEFELLIQKAKDIVNTNK